VMEILKSTARDLGPVGWDDETGFGFLNTLAAVDLAKKTKPEVYKPTAFLKPTTWGGEGLVTPTERAVNIINENFTAWVVSSNGITLRNSPNTSDRSNFVVKTGDTLTFDGWTYGEQLSDLTTGKADALWYRFRYNGGTYWVPSAWTGGYPGSKPPLLPPTQQPPQQPPQQPTANTVYLSTSSGQILQVNTATGAQNSIYQGRAFTDLAVAPNGKLYGCTFYDGLYEINPSTGAERYVGPLAGGSLNSLTFSTDGRLYGADHRDGNLFQISPDNGQMNLIGNLGGPSSGDLVFNGANEIFATVSSPNTSLNDRLVAVNLATGNSRYIGDLGLLEVYGLSWENGQLTAYTSDRRKLAIDPNTATVTVVGTVSSNGLIWGAATKPATASSPTDDVRQKFLYAASLYPQVGAAITGMQDQGGGVFRQEFERAIMIWNGQQVTVYETKGRSVAPTSPSSEPQVNNPSGFNPVVFTRSVGVDTNYGIRLRTDTSLNAPGEGVTHDSQIEFDGWKYGEAVQDRTVANGQMDALWYRIKGTNYWIPSAFINGYPPGYKPPVSSGGNNGSGNVGTDITTPLNSNPTEANPLRGFIHPLGNSKIQPSQGNSTGSHVDRAAYSIDFPANIGTPVSAMRQGKVVAVRDIYPDTGGGSDKANAFNYVLIEHDNGYRSAYIHLQQGFNSRVGLKVGDTVKAGQTIGYSGNSGWSTGPHLHVEVHRAAAGGYLGQTVPFVIGGGAAGDGSSSNDSATDDDYNYDEEDDSLPIGQLIANEVVELTRESLKGLNQAIAEGIRSQFDGIINPLQNKVNEAEKKVANLKSQLESKTDGIINSISSSVIGGLNATAKNELRNAINEVTDGDFLGGAASVTQAVLAKLSSIGLGFVAGLIEGWVDDRINDAFAPVEQALKEANQALQSAKEELQKVTEVVEEIIDDAIDAAADQLNEWTPYVANIVQALFYAGEEWVNNLTNPEFWMNPELWKKFAEFIGGLLITAAVSFVAGAIAGAIGTAISAAGWGITIPAGVATAAAIMGALIGAYMSRDELTALYENAKTAFTNLDEGAKSSRTDEQLQIVGERFANESTDALGKLVTIVANIRVGALAGGLGSKVGSSISSKLVSKGFKAPVSKGFEAPKKYLNANDQLTNGTYTVNNTTMAKHKTGSFKADKNHPQGISQFLPNVDAESAVLDAAAFADKYKLWVGKDLEKATVLTNDYVGALGSTGERTKYLRVFRMKNGDIHGSPATPPIYP
jgi:murein DD-endopeptidase MepM/ murein hydrolase activator NlpD